VMYELVNDAVASADSSEDILLMHDGCLEPGQQRTDVEQTVALLRLVLADGRRCAPLERGVRTNLDEQAARPR